MPQHVPNWVGWDHSGMGPKAENWRRLHCLCEWFTFAVMHLMLKIQDCCLTSHSCVINIQKYLKSYFLDTFLSLYLKISLSTIFVENLSLFLTNDIFIAIRIIFPQVFPVFVLIPFDSSPSPLCLMPTAPLSTISPKQWRQPRSMPVASKLLQTSWRWQGFLISGNAALERRCCSWVNSTGQEYLGGKIWSVWSTVREYMICCYWGCFNEQISEFYHLALVLPEIKYFNYQCMHCPSNAISQPGFNSAQMNENIFASHIFHWNTLAIAPLHALLSRS